MSVPARGGAILFIAFIAFIVPALLLFSAEACAEDRVQHHAFGLLRLDVFNEPDWDGTTSDSAPTGSGSGELATAETQPAPATEHPASAPAQPGFWHRTGIDLRDIVTSPARWDGHDWTVAGLCAGSVVLAGMAADKYFQDESQETRSVTKDRWSGRLGELGTFYSLAVLGGAGVYGWTRGDDRASYVMVDGLEASLIASGVITPTLKFVFGRSRPNKTEQDSDVFHPFRGETSFPSGHATQAFTVASVLSFSYPDHTWLGCTAFIAATGVGLSRINDNAHYLSDVVAGGVIGTWIGYEVVHANRHRRSGAADSFRIQPVITAHGDAIELSWQW